MGNPVHKIGNYQALASKPTLLITLLYFLVCNLVYAEQDSLKLLSDGVKLMSQGKYESALNIFNDVKKIDPSNAQIYFFTGSVLNRLGRSTEALENLDRSLYLSNTLGKSHPHPDLDFERGLALLRLGNYQQAIYSLEAYENSNPGRGQTAEFLGRAYIGIGNYAKAEENFVLALEREPKLEPTIRLAMASLEQKRGQDLLAVQQFYAIRNQSRDDPLSKILTESLPKIARPQEKPWNLFISTGLGYSDNAIAAGDDQPAGAEITDEEDSFFRLAVGGTYTWSPENWQISASHTLQIDRYFDIDEIDQRDHITGLRINHYLNDRSGIGLNLRNRYTYVDDKSFRNENSLTPSFWWRFNQNYVGELSFNYANINFLGSDFLSVQDRDNVTRTITPSLYFNFPDRKFKGNVGVFFAESDADGSDFDYDDQGIIAQVDIDLPNDFVTRFYYTFSDKDYDNTNSISGFTRKRDDDLHYFFVNVSKPIAKFEQSQGNLDFYAQYEYTDRDSSVGFFSYDQYIISAGVVLNF